MAGQFTLVFKILLCLACIQLPGFALLPEPFQNFLRMHMQRAGGVGEGLSPLALLHSWLPRFPQEAAWAFALLRLLILVVMLLMALRISRQNYPKNALPWLSAYSYVYCSLLLFNHVVFRHHFVLLFFPIAVAYASSHSPGSSRAGRFLCWLVVGLNLFSAPTNLWPAAVSRLESHWGFNTWAAFLLLVLHATQALKARNGSSMNARAIFSNILTRRV